MDTEKPDEERIPKVRLPVIEPKKVKKEKTSSKKSNVTVEEPNLNLPKLKSDQVLNQGPDAGEPWNFRSDILLATSLSKQGFFGKSLSQSKSLDFQLSPRVTGISECQLGFKVPSSELISDTSEPEEESLEESNALKRWKFWLKDKIHMQNVLSKKLGRNPCDLQIQESDRYRAIFEDKLLLTYAQIPEFDKWRGNPYFWKERLRLGPRKMGSKLPVYEGTDLKVEKNEVPEMEFIGIPDIIHKEKDRICYPENASFKKWEKNPYRKEQILRFQEQKKKIKPNEIIMNELAVVGVNTIQEQKETEELEEPQNFPKIVISEENSGDLDSRQSVFCLVIGDEQIKYELGTENCQNPDKVFAWQVDFGVNKIGSLVEKVLRVENRGTIAVAYDWISKKNDQNHMSLSSLRPKLHEPWFFFNKNSGLFLPGQIYYLKFYHRSEFSGIQKETWYLKTKPPLSENQEAGAITLSAVATEKFSCEKYAVEYFIEKRVADTVVKFALEVIFFKVFNPLDGLRQIEYRSLFNEKDLFEHHNPKHYYHSSIVKELKELFDEIPSKNQTEWDFSLSSFVDIIKTGKNIQEKNLLVQKIARNSCRLYRPNYLLVKKSNKRKMTYQILCKMMAFIEDDCDYIKHLLSVRKKECVSRSSSREEEEAGEYFDMTPMAYEITPVNYVFYKTMIRHKVHKRLSEAVESIAGMIETSRLFEKRPQDLRPVKPSRRH